MATLITADEVIKIAFNPKDQITTDAMNDYMIEAVQVKFIAPVLGNTFQRLSEYELENFTEEYIKPALAFYIKYSVMGELAVKIGNSGVIRNKNTVYERVATEEISRLRKDAKETADLLLNKAVHFIETNSEMFPEYAARESRHKVNGGIII